MIDEHARAQAGCHLLPVQRHHPIEDGRIMTRLVPPQRVEEFGIEAHGRLPFAPGDHDGRMVLAEGARRTIIEAEHPGTLFGQAGAIDEAITRPPDAVQISSPLSVRRRMPHRANAMSNRPRRRSSTDS